MIGYVQDEEGRDAFAFGDMCDGGEVFVVGRSDAELLAVPIRRGRKTMHAQTGFGGLDDRGNIISKVFLLGNLTRDPEVRYTPKGSAVADLGIAVNRQYTLDNGEKREEVTFVDVTLWGRQAEVAGEYLKKGRSVFIEGRLQLDTWDDKTSGQKRSKLKVIGEMMQMLGGRPGGGGGGPDEGGGGEEAPARSSKSSGGSRSAPPPKGGSSEPDDDEIPF